MSLTIIRGIPGSGKSTLAASLYPYSDKKVVLEADMYFLAETGNYDFDHLQLGKAHAWCLDTTKIMLRNGHNVIVANTFTTWKELKPYIKFAIDNKFEYIIKTLESNYGSIHNVPEDAIERMRDRFQSHQHIMETIESFKKELDSSSTL